MSSWLKIGLRKRLRISGSQPNFKIITHNKRLKNISKELEYFHRAMLPLKDKALALYSYNHH
jgi:hypothetical protein